MNPSRRVLMLLPLALLASPVPITLGAGAKPPAPVSSPSARREVQSVLRLTPDRMHGEQSFRVCAVCHGARDTGLPKGWVPQIAGQHPRVIVKELVDFRHGRRWDLRMQIVAGRHVVKSSQDIADVAAYVASLKPVTAPAVGTGEHLERGRALYQRDCRACHGRSGEGSDARMVPRLAGQDYDYLLRQLHDAIDGRRPELHLTHAKALRLLDAAELEGLADYLARLKPAAAGAQTLRGAGAPEASTGTRARGSSPPLQR